MSDRTGTNSTMNEQQQTQVKFCVEWALFTMKQGLMAYQSNCLLRQALSNQVSSQTSGSSSNCYHFDVMANKYSWPGTNAHSEEACHMVRSLRIFYIIPFNKKMPRLI